MYMSLESTFTKLMAVRPVLRDATRLDLFICIFPRQLTSLRSAVQLLQTTHTCGPDAIKCAQHSYFRCLFGEMAQRNIQAVTLVAQQKIFRWAWPQYFQEKDLKKTHICSAADRVHKLASSMNAKMVFCNSPPNKTG